MSSAAGTAVLDAAVWATWSVVVGAGVHLLPTRCFTHETRLTRLQAFERDGRLYERLRIRRWKDRLPDAGALFSRGGSKRSLPGRSTDALERFVSETRRAEYVHVAVAAIAPLFALWNPWWLTISMLVYAVAANVPCVAIQRYNRGRLQRLLSTRRARGEVVT